ncbi:hypothetical protein PQX77_016075, partial [Marasmius sp. AFHP31]
MPNVRTIEDHFCNLLYKLYKHWPYYEDYSAKSTDRSLIPRIPLDREREALLGLLLQHFFLSRHISFYWGFVACFDFRQAPIYFYEDNLSVYIPLESQNVIDMVAEAIARGYTDLDLHRRSQPLRSTLAMLTLHFWDEAPDGQWPVVKLVQEFYK